MPPKEKGKHKIKSSEKKFLLRYLNWTLVSVPDTETWLQSHTTEMSWQSNMHCTLGVSPNLVSRQREVYSFWGI